MSSKQFNQSMTVFTTSALPTAHAADGCPRVISVDCPQENMGLRRLLH